MNQTVAFFSQSLESYFANLPAMIGYNEAKLFFDNLINDLTRNGATANLIAHMKKKVALAVFPDMKTISLQQFKSDLVKNIIFSLLILLKKPHDKATHTSLILGENLVSECALSLVDFFTKDDQKVVLLTENQDVAQNPDVAHNIACYIAYKSEEQKISDTLSKVPRAFHGKSVIVDLKKTDFDADALVAAAGALISTYRPTDTVFVFDATQRNIADQIKFLLSIKASMNVTSFAVGGAVSLEQELALILSIIHETELPVVMKLEKTSSGELQYVYFDAQKTLLDLLGLQTDVAYAELTTDEVKIEDFDFKDFNNMTYEKWAQIIGFLDVADKKMGINTMLPFVEKLAPFIPGAANMVKNGGFDIENLLAAMKDDGLIVAKMTPQEKKNLTPFTDAAQQRVALAMGKNVREINDFVKRYTHIKQMMEMFGKSGMQNNILKMMGGMSSLDSIGSMFSKKK